MIWVGSRGGGGRGNKHLLVVRNQIWPAALVVVMVVLAEVAEVAGERMVVVDRGGGIKDYLIYIRGMLRGRDSVGRG